MIRDEASENTFSEYIKEEAIKELKQNGFTVVR